MITVMIRAGQIHQAAWRLRETTHMSIEQSYFWDTTELSGEPQGGLPDDLYECLSYGGFDKDGNTMVDFRQDGYLTSLQAGDIIIRDKEGKYIPFQAAHRKLFLDVIECSATMLGVIRTSVSLIMSASTILEHKIKQLTELETKYKGFTFHEVAHGVGNKDIRAKYRVDGVNFNYTHRPQQGDWFRSCGEPV